LNPVKRVRTKFAGWARVGYLPLRTVRLRLTALYGCLFLVSGAGLLAITYLFVSHATSTGFFVTSKNGGAIAGFSSGSGPGGKPIGHGVETVTGSFNSGVVSGSGVPTLIPGISGLTAKQAAQQTHQLQLLAAATRSSELHTLLIESGIALAFMVILSIVLGWLIAGRVLRPLRTITAATRQISATNLHERLAMDGPNDELKELGNTIDGLLERLEASFRSQRQFVANASHELRTPLARQRTLAQVALTDPRASVDSLRSAHERILVSGVQQERLLDALLTLTRVNAGGERREWFDLATVARELLVVKVAEAELRDLRVDVVLASAPVLADRRLVELMLVNLLDNAIRHNIPQGGIEVETGWIDTHAFVSIANDGAMVQPEEIGRLFEPFQRLGAERTNRGEGFGLGLCIVEAVAKAQDAVVATRARETGGLSLQVDFAGGDDGGWQPAASVRTRARSVDAAATKEGIEALQDG
jgi:signal transduction histidine kinase